MTECRDIKTRLRKTDPARAGEMIPEVRGTRPWGPPRKRVHKCLKGHKASCATIAIAEKQSKRSKKGPFSLYIGPPGPTQEMKLMGPGGEGPSRPPPPPHPGFCSHGLGPRAAIFPANCGRKNVYKVMSGQKTASCWYFLTSKTNVK